MNDYHKLNIESKISKCGKVMYASSHKILCLKIFTKDVLNFLKYYIIFYISNFHSVLVIHIN
jgi:hypothetical protein